MSRGPIEGARPREHRWGWIAACSLLVALGVVWLLSWGGSAPPTPASPVPSADASPAVHAPVVPSAPSAQEPPSRSPAAATAGAGTLEVVGRVEDDFGKPLRGATVTLAGLRSTTDDDGIFRFEEAPAKPEHIVASQPGHFDSKLWWWPPDQGPPLDVVLRLVRHRFVSGFVVDENEAPVEANVSLSGRASDESSLSLSEKAWGGAFRLGPVKAGEYSASAHAFPRTSEHREVRVGSQDVTGLVLRLDSAWEARFAGRVRDCATGEPLHRVVFLVEDPDPKGAEWGSSAETLSNSEGRFELSVARREPSIQLRLSFARSTHESRILDMRFGSESHPFGPLEICLETRRSGKGSIEGTVVYDDGAWLEGPVEFHAWRPQYMEPRRLRELSETFATNGVFVVGDLEPGDFLAWVVVPGCVSLKEDLAQVVRVDPGAVTRARWVLPRGGEVRLEWNHPHGDPDSGFEVTIRSEARAVRGRGRDGVAIFRGVPPGRYWLSRGGPDEKPPEETFLVEAGGSVTVTLP